MRLSARKPANPAYPKELKSLGDHIRKRRLDLGLLQKDVAQRLGVDTTSVFNWETHRSNPMAYLIPKIAEFLGYLPDEPVGSFPEMLRTYRRAAGLSQRRLAKLALIDESTLAKWERGATYPMAGTLIRLRQLFAKLGLSPQDFDDAVTYNVTRRSEAAHKAWRGRRELSAKR